MNAKVEFSSTDTVDEQKGFPDIKCEQKNKTNGSNFFSHSVCLGLNIQGMNPGPRSKGFRKIFQIREEIDELINCGFYIPFIAINESWLKDNISDAQIYIENFNVFRSDRKKSKNGGVVLYVNKNIIVSEVVYFDDDVCSGIICLCKHIKCIISCVYRPPKSENESFLNLLEFLNDFISDHNHEDKLQVLIFGDFNFPKICWETASSFSVSSEDLSSHLITFMDKFFMSQYVQESTRKNNILDLFITNNPNFVQLIKVSDIDISDHKLVQIFTNSFPNCNALSSPNAVQPIESTADGDFDFSKFDLHSADFNLINFEFSNIDWNNLIEDEVELFPDGFHQVVYSVLSRHCKLKIQNKHFRKGTKFFHKKLDIINRKIRRHKKRSNRLGLSSSKSEKIKTKILSLKDEKRKFFLDHRLKEEGSAVSKIKTNTKYFFKYANRFRKVVSSPSILLDSLDDPVVDQRKIADLLQDQFRSVFSTPNKNFDPTFLTKKFTIDFPLSKINITDRDIITAINEIRPDSSCPKYDIPAIVFKNCKNTLCTPLRLFWQKSFESGIIPTKYKRQLIIPLYKKGLKTKPENYRPVSLTAHTIKIFERYLREVLVNFFESNQLFSSNQHGFRNKRSCLTQLLSHISNILTNSTNGNETDCVYVDFAKAFDKVDHDILLKKLSHYNIPEMYLNWIKNFLEGRVQTVFVNGSFSYPTRVESGVPQGSVLGPLLFIIYINDLSFFIKNSNILTFADDTKLIAEICNTSDTSKLQDDLNQVVLWSEVNNMVLNKNKFELINHRLNDQNKIQKNFKELPFNNGFFTYNASNNIADIVCEKVSDGITINPSTHVRDLGILVDSKLNWKAQINQVTSKAKQMCGWFLSVFHTRDKHTMIMLFNSLVRSKLEYCDVIWNPHLLSDIIKIESVQRYFTTKVNGMRDLDYWQRLKALDIMSLQRRRERSLIITLWKIKNNIIPNFFEIDFKENKRFESITAVVKPLPKVDGRVLTGRVVTVYDKSFPIVSARLWNVLPGRLTHVSSLVSFKSGLDKFLRLIPDEPPLPGYPSGSNKNSLIEQCLGLNLK